MFGERVSVLFRVSTDQQAQSGLGIDAQKAAVAAKVAQERWEVVKTTTERGVSGKSPLSARQGLTEAMAVVAAGKAEILLVAKLCRLSRDPMNSLIIEKTITKAGGRVVSCAGEGTDSDDPSQVLMRRVMSAVAENEAAMISQRTRVALAAKKARGERLGRPPFGFVVHDGELVPGPLFPELAACCALLGWADQSPEERTAWTGHPNHGPWGPSEGKGGGMKSFDKTRKYMTHRDMAEHLTKYHGERTTWSHDKVGRISRRHSPDTRKEIVDTWKKMTKED
jgi:DNA invertase Pin-like site-specific DNA recombinase|tara:strand:+ start:387 stop:1229 length:843 start_codon:yes stop_codon:yes gene_type:complete